MATDSDKGKENEACDPKLDKSEKSQALDPKQWRTLTLAQRMYLVEHLVVRHERFNRLLAKIEYCASFGAGGEVPTENPPCIAILGEAHVGKTKLIETWLADAPLIERETEEGTIIPYLLVLIPSSPPKKRRCRRLFTGPARPQSEPWHRVGYDRAHSSPHYPLPGAHHFCG